LKARRRKTEDRRQKRIADCGLRKGAGYKVQGTRQDKTIFFPCALSLEPYASLATDSCLLTPCNGLLTTDNAPYAHCLTVPYKSNRLGLKP
jgi:hypothetical protein